MELASSRIVAILVVHAVIALIQWTLRRWVRLNTMGLLGVYLLLLPVGFNCFGWELSPFFLAFWVLLGLFVLMGSLRRRSNAEVTAPCSAP